MDKIDVISQIEEELTWRKDEFYFFKNQLSKMEKESDRERYRKSLVVMLYSHYEGFCKSGFTVYVNAVNSERLLRSDVNIFIRTVSLNDIFLEYGNEAQKDSRFKKKLPEDKKLHKYSRQITFLEQFSSFLNETVNIPEEVVDTESNLKPVVLKKILYRLGFPFKEIELSDNTINKLLNYRNGIAHGSHKMGIEEQSYEELEASVMSLMDSIRLIILDAIHDDLFLKEEV
ncbi:hypothetical protein HCA87_01205 [Listeria welshimeri]|nr:hypothetical protein [Listeria welshimeri]